MSSLRLILDSLRHHLRGNLAVLLGVLVGSTVLTGALLVGDSLQGSLRDRSLRQLGWVDQVLVSPRLFRAGLASELANRTRQRVGAAILLRTTVQVAGEAPDRAMVRGVQVLGVDDAFFDRDAPGGAFAWANAELARDLRLRPGQALEVRLVQPSALPREAVLARKDLGIRSWRVEVSRILEGDEPGNHFQPWPSLDAPRNLLVPLSQVQEQLESAGMANALFASGTVAPLQSALADSARLEDYGLMLFTPAGRARSLLERYDRNRDGQLRGAEWFRRVDGKRKPRFAAVDAEGMKPAKPDVLTSPEIAEYYEREHPYICLESKQLLLSPAVIRATEQAAEKAGLSLAETLVYLSRMESQGKKVAGVVAALPPDGAAPLGPFLPGGLARLADDEILLVEEGWPAETRPRVGDAVELIYKSPESHGPSQDQRRSFKVAGFLPVRGVTADPSLTPEFPGITDKEDAGDWTLPFDDPNWQQQVIRREYTDAFWDRYRATPKAYITLTAGQKLWASRFGSVTSIRLAPGGVASPTAQQLEQSANRFREELLRALVPEQSGLVFSPVKEEALKASKGGTPFGLLFLGFSFFLIASSLLLVGLLFRLNLERRAKELGLLFAEGFTRRRVSGLLLAEGAMVALVGSVLGGVGGLLYSRFLVRMLSALWPGGALESFLRPHWTWVSLLAGMGGALAVSLATIAWVARGMAKTPPRMLLAGRTSSEEEPGGDRPRRWAWLLAIALPILGLILLPIGSLVEGHEARAGTFFGSGALFLAGGLFALRAWMNRNSHHLVEGHGFWPVLRLGILNATRYPLRSMLTVGLLASSAFLLVAVESFRRRAESTDGAITGPDGGFALLAESDLPLLRDPNSPAGRKEILDSYERSLTRGAAASDVADRVKRAEQLLQQTNIVALRASKGDDASCLNLYEPRSPRVLGVPAGLIERGGFHFQNTLAKSAEERSNPWRLLDAPGDDVPCFGEANTVMWMLKSGLGKTVSLADETLRSVPFRIVGLLQDSVFQSGLIVSEDRFLRLFPDQEGYTHFLIAPPAGAQDEVKRILETALDDRGLAVSRSSDRLESFLAVENTYLTTFQALGGLGLILGSLGLAVVLLRSIWERRSELALLRALGWPARTLGGLILAENGFLLVAGLVLGAGAALLSISPQLLHGLGTIPWSNLGWLFLVVLGAGFLAGTLAMLGTLRAPLVPALRRE